MRTSVIGPERSRTKSPISGNDGGLGNMGQILHSSVMLHDSTAPEAISDLQRREVRRYLDRFPRRSQPQIEQIADALDLPVCSVRWRLTELGVNVPAIVKSRPLAEIVHEWLTKNGPATTAEIEKGIEGLFSFKPGKVVNLLNHWDCKYRKSYSGKIVKWSVI